MDKRYSIYEMENVFEIGRTIEAMQKDGQLDEDIDSKNLFAFAVNLAQEFEEVNPCPDDYYGELDEFIVPRIKKEFGRRLK